MAHALRLDAAFSRRLARYIMAEALGPSFMSEPARVGDRESFQADLASKLTPTMIPAIRGTVRYPENRLEMLGRIHVPTLVMAGEEDDSAGGGVNHAREVATGIENSRLITIPRAGHGLLLEQPELVSSLIADFVSQVNQTTVRDGPAL